PHALAQSAKLAQDAGFDEVNINVGCPSDRVQSGCFGAALMAQPELVAQCVSEMRDKTSIPITVKTRIGIDDRDSYEELCHFVKTVGDAGCELFIIHARKAWLSGLSPKENREIPPLCYDVVRKLKHDFPNNQFVLNGGIETLADAIKHLATFDGVMLGRAAYHNPYLLAEVDAKVFGQSHEVPSRDAVLEQYCEYAKRALADGVPLRLLAKHVLGLYHGTPGARVWRRMVSEGLQQRNDVGLLLDARAYIQGRADLAVAV
nr:tRNA dihydrouridine(20/20a) synthase DusA [Gammaproteobacteria bacterium]